MLTTNYFEFLFLKSNLCIVITDGVGNVLKQNEMSKKKIGEIKSQNLLDIIKFEEEQFVSPSEMLDKDLDGEIRSNGQIQYLTISTVKIQDKLVSTEFVFIMIDRTETKLKEDQIKAMQDKMIASSYRDGVAESAIATLHNIGNILTSIISNIPTGNRLKAIELSKKIIQKIIKNIDENKFDAEKTKKILSEMNIALDEFNELISNVHHEVIGKCMYIGDIIQTQQNFANYKNKELTKIFPKQIVEDCLLLSQKMIEQSRIKIVKNFQDTDPIMMDKIGLSQTITNIINNSIESMNEKQNSISDYTPELAIRTEKIKDFLLITFIDDGMGIEKETLNNLFQFGFSTKNRSSGFGLHQCSNYMIQNNGKIKIYSDGKYEGAKVVLFCPIAKD